MASSPAAVAADKQSDEKAFEKQAGDVKSACANDAKSGHLICAIVYAKQPYFGVQLGSEDDPDSVAVTAGVRRSAGSKIEMRVDDNASHFIYGDGFLGKEAETLLDEIEKGRRIYVRVDPWDENVKTEDHIDLDEFKAAVREIEEIRGSQKPQ